MVGYNTPENTLQTLLWAVQNHDLTNLLQAFTPERVTGITAAAAGPGKSLDAFFRDSTAVPGMAVVGRKQVADDGSIELEVEIIPGLPHAEISFQQTNGQWKIAGPFRTAGIFIVPPPAVGRERLSVRAAARGEGGPIRPVSGIQGAHGVARPAILGGKAVAPMARCPFHLAQARSRLALRALGG